MQMTIRTQGIILKRVHSKMGQRIAWQVNSSDDMIRLGVIWQIYDWWNIKWKTIMQKDIPQSVWIGTGFFPNRYVIGLTRASVIRQLLETK